MSFHEIQYGLVAISRAIVTLAESVDNFSKAYNADKTTTIINVNVDAQSSNQAKKIVDAINQADKTRRV